MQFFIQPVLILNNLYNKVTIRLVTHLISAKWSSFVLLSDSLLQNTRLLLKIDKIQDFQDVLI